MNLKDFYQQEDTTLRFNREQASRFAKEVAGDFNPIHDIDARRFCVPGDLLFAILLKQQGLFSNMEIEFAGMVTEQSEVLTQVSSGEVRFVKEDGADFIIAHHNQQSCGDVQFIEALTCAYVTFSGHTFPHILVPLMKEHDVMINPARPMVMYRKMSLTLDTCSGDNIALAYTGAELKASGKKGEVSFFFDITADGEVIGKGMKNMLLSGLRPYEQAVIDDIVIEYEQRKIDWSGNSA